MNQSDKYDESMGMRTKNYKKNQSIHVLYAKKEEGGRDLPMSPQCVDLAHGGGSAGF